MKRNFNGDFFASVVSSLHSQKCHGPAQCKFVPASIIKNLIVRSFVVANEGVIVIYGRPLTNYTCGLKSKNALCSKKTRRTAKLNQSKKSIKLKKTNELRQSLKQLGSIVGSKK